MSMFLGPIHYMMFNKIKVAADRARTVIETFHERYPAETDETVKNALPNGPVDFGDKSLDELLGEENIHGFLQGLIDQVEVAEASLVTALLYRFPDDGEKLLEKAFHGHGGKTALKAVAESGNGGPALATFQRVLGSQLLEGMPCDINSSYRMKDDKTLEVTHTDCLHRLKWEEAGAPVHTMCRLLDQWAQGAAAVVDPTLKIKRAAAIADGADDCRCVVSA